MSGLITTVLLVLELTGLAGHLPTSWTGQLTSWALPAASTSARHIQATVDYQPRPIPTVSTSQLSLGAAAVIAIDRSTGTVLYEKSSRERRPIASITKLMTTLVILSRHQLDEVVTVPALPAYSADAAQIHLAAGERLALRDMLAAALIPSANDAADALAIWDAGSVTAFTDRMNSLAATWGLSGSHFASASGLSDDQNYSTAADLARIASLALTNATVRSLVSTSRATVTSTSGHSYTLATTNQLLKDPRFSGIKTGYTPAAGQSVSALAAVSGHSVITVVLGSPDRFGETTQLINYLEGSTLWQ